MSIEETLPQVDKFATLIIPGKDPIKLPILRGTMGPEVIDILVNLVNKDILPTTQALSPPPLVCPVLLLLMVKKASCFIAATQSISWQLKLIIYKFAIFYLKANFQTRNNTKILPTK